LRIDNLEYTVSDDDLRNLFEVIGPLKKASIHYDRSGRSDGSGEVNFIKRADAVRAQKKYNGVALDGKPMKISLLDDDSGNAGGGDLFSRLGSSTRTTAPAAPARTGIVVTARNPRATRGRVISRTTFRSSFRRTGPPSADDLDRELDDYNRVN